MRLCTSGGETTRRYSLATFGSSIPPSGRNGGMLQILVGHIRQQHSTIPAGCPVPYATCLQDRHALVGRRLPDVIRGREARVTAADHRHVHVEIGGQRRVVRRLTTHPETMVEVPHGMLRKHGW